MDYFDHLTGTYYPIFSENNNLFSNYCWIVLSLEEKELLLTHGWELCLWHKLTVYVTDEQKKAKFINYMGISQNRKMTTRRNFYTFLLEDVGDRGCSLEMNCSREEKRNSEKNGD